MTEQETREYISSLDLSIVAWKLHLPVEKRGEGWSVEKIKKIEEQYRGFLFIAWKYPHEIFAPPTFDIDVYWHTHILFTKKYTADCEVIFGRYLPHTPGVQETDISEEFLEAYKD